MKFQHFEEWMVFWKESRQPERRQEDKEDWVKDGSLDIKGRPVLRSKTGGWKAAFFTLVVDFSDRFAYFSIAANLITYLTTVLQEGLATSAKTVSYWAGVTCVTPLVGGFIADVYCGRYWMVLISLIIYVPGLLLLTLSVSVSSLKPPGRCDGICSKATPKQIGLFLLSLYLISLGTAGRPSLTAFGADQFDEEDKTERAKKSSFFNFSYFAALAGLLLAVTVIAYVEYNVSWGCGFGIVTVTMAIATVVFLYGTPFYRHKLPGDHSPITRMAQVVVAAIRKRNMGMPSDVSFLYENQDVEFIKSGQRHLSHTDSFRFLDKAAITVQNNSELNTDTQVSVKTNPWKVCTVSQVEETKLILRMVPIWLSCLIFGIAAVSQSGTFFIKQGSTMDRSMGSHFQIQPVSLAVFSTISGLAFITIYDRYIVPLGRRIRGDERGLTVLQRIGFGLFFSVLCMVTSALVEKKRIHVAETHGLLDSPQTTIPLSVFWLAPQFALSGIADVFTLVGLQEYFYQETPDSMRSLGIAFYASILGVSSFLNGFLITLVDGITKRGGHQGWLVNNLNRCKLDYFYWLLAILSAVNLCSYVYIAHIYTYKKVKKIVTDTTDVA